MSKDTPAFSALEARSSGFVPIPLDLARRIGPAAQTLGSLLSAFRQDGEVIFRVQASLARSAGVGIRTLRLHLRQLEQEGLIETIPEPFDRNRHRLTKPESQILAAYVPLPRFALDLPWTARLLYGYLVYRAEISPAGNTIADPVRDLARVLAVDRRHIRTALGTLQDRGFLQKTGTVLTLIRPPGQAGRILPTTQGAHFADLLRSGSEEQQKTSSVVSTKRKALLRLSPEELTDNPALDRRFDEAVEAGLVRDTGQDRLRFYGAAVHAGRVARDPAALFAWLVRGEHWAHVTAADEDRALDRLRDRNRPPPVADLAAGIGQLPSE